MEVICIENTAFYKLVEQVAARVLESYSERPFKWVTPEKAMSLLNISSKTTMQKLRDEGKIRFSQPAKKTILYDLHSINDFLESHAREPFHKKK